METLYHPSCPIVTGTLVVVKGPSPGEVGDDARELLRVRVEVVKREAAREVARSAGEVDAAEELPMDVFRGWSGGLGSFSTCGEGQGREARGEEQKVVGDQR